MHLGDSQLSQRLSMLLHFIRRLRSKSTSFYSATCSSKINVS